MAMLNDGNFHCFKTTVKDISIDRIATIARANYDHIIASYFSLVFSPKSGIPDYDNDYDILTSILTSTDCYFTFRKINSCKFGIGIFMNGNKYSVQSFISELMTKGIDHSYKVEKSNYVEAFSTDGSNSNIKKLNSIQSIMKYAIFQADYDEEIYCGCEVHKIKNSNDAVKFTHIPITINNDGVIRINKEDRDCLGLIKGNTNATIFPRFDGDESIKISIFHNAVHGGYKMAEKNKCAIFPTKELFDEYKYDYKNYIYRFVISKIDDNSFILTPVVRRR